MAIVREKKRFGDILVAARVITEAELKRGLEEQKKTRQKLGTTLVSMGLITEAQIGQALRSQMGYDIVDLSGVKVSVDVLNLVKDSTVLKRYTVMPFEFDKYDSNYLRVAMADPMDLTALDDLQMITGMQINPVIATSTEIMAAIDKYYGHAETQAVAELYAKEKGEQAVEEESIDEKVENAPIVLLVKKIIEQAARMRASDIHIEPTVNRIRVRYRIDGVLQETGSYQLSMLPAMITRIKIIGGMDISEKRKPQDGRITQVVDRFEYDIRASVLPTVYGEKVVMRLTAKNQLTRNKADLGLNPEDLKRFDKIFSNPNGIILVTGPTGSGKSTTLYTALSELNTDGVNIITVEDPVEANIDGVNQVQVNPKADLTFASALRSILRQDPDIIMIGEIRDQETASIAVTASITGHLVVSTLHTNSAAASLTRLENMGIESYLLADSTVGVMAQRLARRLCTCKRCRKATSEEKRLLGVIDSEELEIYEPSGCVTCNETGYRGRIGVYEIMPITPRIRSIIAQNGTTEDIEKVAIEEGMNTLKMSCAKLVKEGVTSIEEMRRIVYSNDEELSE
ncbi:MAG: Flp pilus assembly complex ATPase component TadA [Lachnospiraceae bacterium]|nr:Flp pilus assembly complex ATPase component TadA [Lachnospiraceae bacterium]